MYKDQVEMVKQELEKAKMLLDHHEDNQANHDDPDEKNSVYVASLDRVIILMTKVNCELVGELKTWNR